MFTTIIIQPIFNLLVFIYAIIPGHNFGLAIILFTIIVRLLMWPLVKKQLHHAKALRELQPEIKRIKKEAAGDKRKEQMMTMELYKEREINPLASVGILVVQLPILIGLYAGLNRIIKNPHQLITFSYPFINHLSWMKELSHNIHQFDNSLFGIVDLSRAASSAKGWYWPAAIIVFASAITQFYQSKQLLPKSKDARNLRTILSDASRGRQADQQEVNAAVGRFSQFFIPFIVFWVGLRFASALPLYWLSSSVVAYIQQARILRDDAQEADKSVASSQIIEGEVVTKPKTKNKKKASKKSKRRKR